MRDYIRLNSPDIVALQETWFKSNNRRFTNIKTPKMNSYIPIREDRPHKKCGGLMFYIKPNIKYTEKEMQFFPNGKIEIQCISIKIKNSEIDILNIYIPPNSRLYKTELLHYHQQLQRKFIICGDMNAHHHTWDSESNTPNNRIGKIIFEILEENDNISLTTPPNLKTYTNSGTAKMSTIDLCINATHLNTDIQIKKLPDMGSDHYPIQIKLAIGPDKMSRGKRSK